MKMLKDHELYIQLCEKRSMKSPPEILEAIINSGSTGELHLSRISILVPICEIIGQVLISSSAIKSIDLSDCMLLSKGLSHILNALSEGSNITSLNLKGNNINGPTVAQLGQVLTHNNTLKKLNIEWNSVGSHVDSFTKFTEGLTKNHNIEELDLRYNQISPYCAEALSRVLKWNKSLKVLDIAWNTIGLQGGQLLLAGIEDNKNLIKLNLHGNCIPNDVLQSIEDKTRNNQSRLLISATSISKGIEKAKSVLLKDKSKVVSFTDSDSTIKTRLKYRRKKRNEINKLSYRKEKKNTSFTENSDDTDSDNSMIRSDPIIGVKENPTTCNDKDNEKCNTENSPTPDDYVIKIKELNQILEDRTTAINLLTNEIAVKSAEVETVRSQVDQLKTEIAGLKEERDKSKVERIKEISELKDKNKEAELKWEKVYNELEINWRKSLTQRKELDIKVRRYERDIHKSSIEIATLKDKIITVTQTYEDLVSKDKTEIHRLRRELKERDNRHKNETNSVKNTLRETTQALEDCQNQLQKSRNELRDVTESQIVLKAKVNEIEHINVRYSRSEETLHKLKEEKDHLEEKLIESKRVTSNLQRQIVALQSELVEPQRRYELLNDELLQEKEKNGRLKEELIEERERAKEQNIQMQKMTLQITALNAQINDIQLSHAETLREKDKERKQLKEIIAIKEQDINDLKAEEVQRAGQLYAAFTKYLGFRGPNPAL